MKFSAVLTAAFAAALGAVSPALSTGAPAPEPTATSMRDQNIELAWFKSGNVTRSGLQDTHIVALTFDDGPNQNTVAVLDALRKYHVKATFFVVGDMARTHMKILRQIADEGHLLANHSATHPRFGGRFVKHPERLIEQLQEVDDLIRPLMAPGDNLFFRAPYGYWRKQHSVALNADPVLKYYAGPIYWDEGGNTSVDEEGYVRSAADWDCWPRGWSAETCGKGYVREIMAKDGGVVLMHCIHHLSGDLVEAVVPALQAKGYTFVRLDRVPGYDQYKGPPPTLRPVITALNAPPRLLIH